MHNSQTAFANFYGVQYKSRIMIVSNDTPATPKVYNHLGIVANLTPSLTYFRSEFPYVQGSDLLANEYDDREGVLYAFIFNDKLTLRAVPGYSNGLISGEKMRTSALRILFEFDTLTTALSFKFVNLFYAISKGHLM